MTGKVSRRAGVESSEDLDGWLQSAPKTGMCRVGVAAMLIGVSESTVIRRWHEGFLDGEIRREGREAPIWLTLPSVHAYAERHARLERSRLALKDGRVRDVEFEEDDLLDSSEVAVIVNVTAQTINNWVRAGVIKDVERTVGGNARIPFSSVRRLVNQKGRRWS